MREHNPWDWYCVKIPGEPTRDDARCERCRNPEPYPSARVRAALAEAYDRSAPPMGWPYPEKVTQA